MDYNHAEDPEYKRLRDMANKEYERKKQLSEESQAAYKSGDGAEAKRLSELSQKHADKMDDYNRQAAEWVFRANNADSAEDEIDLHGLYVKEAISMLQTRIDAARARGETHLDVIVGKGNHSQNHVAKIKPAVEDLCRQMNFKYALENGNSGVLVVDLTGPGGQVDWNQLAPRPNKKPSNKLQNHYQQQGAHYGQNQYSQQQQHHNNNHQGGNDDVVNILCGIFKIIRKCLN